MTDPALDAAFIPVSEANAVTTYRPVVVPVEGRPIDLAVSVSAPATGENLPVIVFSHGHGPSNFVGSMYGYKPLVDFWASHGFVVLQPNHLDATFLGLRESDNPDAPLFLRNRAADLRAVLDNLDLIESTVPGLAGRLDRTKIAAVGHSAGGNTIGLVSGMTNIDPTNGSVYGEIEPRFAARVLMAAPGNGEDLDGQAGDFYPGLKGSNFAGMTPEALIITGEKDAHPFFASRATWRGDAFTESPSPKTQLTLLEAEHMLGGISGYDAAETSDENPERVAVLRAMIWAYLRSALFTGDTSWRDATAALAAHETPIAEVTTK
ncbi:alpha/beta hydrolase family protein [Frondihabitans cladoniiphilus]|uniref:Alpha/beta fold hydrolase n=1 Tax=Frondihabitans cladoniiphilus TaxID=715785 RepID=A0ABP8W7N6_9MICO